MEKVAINMAIKVIVVVNLAVYFTRMTNAKRPSTSFMTRLSPYSKNNPYENTYRKCMS